jgi:hypothetical protein
MPDYVATLASNKRAYQAWEFQAANDEEGRRILREREKAGAIPRNADGDVAEADVREPIMWLDRRIEGSSQREDVEDEISFLGVLYYRDAAAFVKKVAVLSEGGAYDNAIETLDQLILEASKLIGGIEVSA